MKHVINSIQNELESHNVSYRQVAKELSVSNGTITNLFQKHDGMLFNKFGELVSLTFSNQLEKWRSYCKTYFLGTKRDLNKRIAFHYLMAHGEVNLIKNLVDQEKTSKSKENREHAYLYELMYKRYKGITRGESLLSELKKIKISKKTKEVSILYEIILMQSTYDRGNYKLMLDTANYLMEEVQGVSDTYIKEFFTYKIVECRIQGLFASCELKLLHDLCSELIGNPEIIKHYPITYATVHGVLGESFLFTDYEKSLYHLKKALSVFEERTDEGMSMRREAILNTISFLNIHWKKDLDKIKPSHKAEKAYLDIQKGNNDIAIKLLRELEKENGTLSPFQLYYLALATGDREIMIQSLHKFDALGNIFYSQLPKFQLGIM